jgi:hypothetical protein
MLKDCGQIDGCAEPWFVMDRGSARPQALPVFGKGEHRFRAKPIRSLGSLALPKTFSCDLCDLLRLSKMVRGKA